MGFLDFLHSIVNAFCGGSSPPDGKLTGVQTATALPTRPRPPQPPPRLQRPQPPQLQKPLPPLPAGAWLTLPSQAQRPAGRQDRRPREVTISQQTQVLPPDRQLSRHDHTRYQGGLSGIPSEPRLSPTYRQPPPSHSADSYYPAHSQYPDYQTPSQSYPPRRQPSALYPTETPLVPPYVVVTEPVNTQPPRPAITTPEVAVAPLVNRYPSTLQYPDYQTPLQSYPPRRQPNTLFPIETTPLVPPDAPVTQPVTYTQPPRPATAVAPEEGVEPLVIDPHEDHESLRLKARSEGDRMAEYFQQATDAFARNEKRLAKELSLKGQVHKANMVRLNKEASAMIFQENNKRSKPNTIDLHGLYVTEAEFYFEKTVEEVRDREQPLRVIVGKGNHSDGNTPKIKPAICALGEKLGMTVNVDPRNDGCLVVNFK